MLKQYFLFTLEIFSLFLLLRSLQKVSLNFHIFIKELKFNDRNNKKTRKLT